MVRQRLLLLSAGAAAGSRKGMASVNSETLRAATAGESYMRNLGSYRLGS